MPQRLTANGLGRAVVRASHSLPRSQPSQIATPVTAYDQLTTTPRSALAAHCSSRADWLAQHQRLRSNSDQLRLSHSEATQSHNLQQRDHRCSRSSLSSKKLNRAEWKARHAELRGVNRRQIHSTTQPAVGGQLAQSFAPPASTDQLRVNLQGFLAQKREGARPLVAVLEAPSFLCNQDILSASQFTRDQVEQVIATSAYVRQLQKNAPLDLLSDCRLGMLFFESSTRMSSSFQAAMHQMGGKVIRFAPSVKEVSVDTLAEAMEMVGQHCEALAVRHSIAGGIGQAAPRLPIPVLNLGDGTGENPTQALLDAYVMRSELGALDGLNVTLVGDLTSSPDAHSIAQLLSNFDVTLNIVPTRGRGMPTESGQDCAQHADISEVIASTDVLYCADGHNLPREVQREMKPGSLVMHSGPRSLFHKPASRASHHGQMEYSQSLRAALLSMVFGRL